MLQSSKKTAKLSMINLMVTIGILVISVVAWLICQFAVGEEKLGFHPLLLLFMVFFVIEGFYLIQLGLFTKNPFVWAVGAVGFDVGLVFSFIACKLLWWVALIICLVVLIIAFLGMFVIKAPQLVVEMDNAPDANYKTFEERQEEKKAEQDLEEEKPLPELKSFKD